MQVRLNYKQSGTWKVIFGARADTFFLSLSLPFSFNVVVNSPHESTGQYVSPVHPVHAPSRVREGWLHTYLHDTGQCEEPIAEWEALEAAPAWEHEALIRRSVSFTSVYNERDTVCTLIPFRDISAGADIKFAGQKPENNVQRVRRITFTYKIWPLPPPRRRE